MKIEKKVITDEQGNLKCFIRCSLSLRRMAHVSWDRFPLLLLIHVKIDSVGVGRRDDWCLGRRWRTIATLRTTAGGHEAHGSASLTFQFRHGICTFLVLVAFPFFACCGLLLTSGNGLRCNIADIGTIDNVRKCVSPLMIAGISYLYLA